ncbi:MAG: hypothetical protein AB7V26_11035 [Lysobacterales bacterium]
MMPAIDAIGAIAQILDALIDWAGGWHYVFSSAYRRSVHARWRGQHRMRVLAEVTSCAAGFVLFNGLIVLALVGMIRGW